MKLVVFLTMAFAAISGLQAQSADDIRHAQILDAIDAAGIRSQLGAQGYSVEWVTWYLRTQRTADRAYIAGAYDTATRIVERKSQQQELLNLQLRQLELMAEAAAIRAQTEK